MKAAAITPSDFPTLVRLRPDRWVRDDPPGTYGLDLHPDPTADEVIRRLQPNSRHNRATTVVA